MVKKVIRVCISEPVLLDLDETRRRLKISRSQLIERCVIEGLPKIKEREKVAEEKRYDSEETDAEFLEWCRTAVGIDV